MLNEFNPIPKHPLTKAIQQELDKGWKLLSKNFRKFITIIGVLAIIIFIISLAAGQVKNVFFDTKEEVHKPVFTPTPLPENTPHPETFGTSDCKTLDMSNFTKNEWSGFSWFSISNGVWTLKEENKIETDAVIYYLTNCTGNSLVQFHVTPRLEDFINLNVYLRGQLRWEVGGRDRRSIRLWKNTVGCQSGEIKGAEPLLNMYLPNHDEILIDQPLIVNMATYFLKNGKIRNELWLTYSSKKNTGQEITTPRSSFFYDFEAGSICDTNHLPNINQESYQFGLGLQQTILKAEDIQPKMPRVSFEKFKISDFSE